jgi:hypothetical protein
MDLMLYLLEHKIFASSQTYVQNIYGDSLLIPLEEWNQATGMNVNNDSCHLLDDMDFMVDDGYIELMQENGTWFVSLLCM